MLISSHIVIMTRYHTNFMQKIDALIYSAKMNKNAAT